MLTKEKRKNRLLKKFRNCGIRLSANDVSIRYRKELRITEGMRPPAPHIEGLKALKLIFKEGIVFLFSYEQRGTKAKLFREIKEHEKEQKNRDFCPIE